MQYEKYNSEREINEYQAQIKKMYEDIHLLDDHIYSLNENEKFPVKLLGYIVNTTTSGIMRSLEDKMALRSKEIDLLKERIEDIKREHAYTMKALQYCSFVNTTRLRLSSSTDRRPRISMMVPVDELAKIHLVEMFSTSSALDFRSVKLLITNEDVRAYDILVFSRYCIYVVFEDDEHRGHNGSNGNLILGRVNNDARYAVAFDYDITPLVKKYNVKTADQFRWLYENLLDDKKVFTLAGKDIVIRSRVKAMRLT